MTRTWVKLITAGKREYMAEDNGDGSYTVWTPSLWGPVGQRGTPSVTLTIKPITSRKDREWAESEERSLERSLASQNALFQLEKMRREMNGSQPA